MITSRALVAYVGIVGLAILLVFFAGTAYVPLLGTLLPLSLGLWVASEKRWRSLLEFLFGPAKSARWGDAPWTPRYSVLLILDGLIWLAITVVAFLFANVSLLSVLRR
jgi:hypothetical protein